MTGFTRNNVLDFDDDGLSYGGPTGIHLAANWEDFRIQRDIFSNPEEHEERVPWRCYKSAYGALKDHVRRYLQAQYLVPPGGFDHTTDVRILDAGLLIGVRRAALGLNLKYTAKLFAWLSSSRRSIPYT